MHRNKTNKLQFRNFSTQSSYKYSSNQQISKYNFSLPTKSPSQMFWKILQYLKENTCARVCFFCKVTDLKLQFYLKNQLQHRCFPVNNEKFLRTAFLYKTSGGYLYLPAYATSPSPSFTQGRIKVIAKATCCFWNFWKQRSRLIFFGSWSYTVFFDEYCFWKYTHIHAYTEQFIGQSKEIKQK